MKLTIKDLTQQKFTVEAEAEQSIQQLKEAISKEKGWEVGAQKLIYSGKILDNTKTVGFYNIEEKGFIPKAQPAASSSAVQPPQTPAPASARTPAAPDAPAQTARSSSNAPNTPTPVAPAAPSTEPANFNDPSSLALGAHRDAAIQNMESMGFERSQIDRAMRAAFFNPDRAVEYLLNGIPENVQQEQQAPRPASARPASATGTATSPPPATGNAPAPSTNTDSDQPINLFEAAAQANRNTPASGAARDRSAATAAAAAGLVNLSGAGGTGAGGAAGAGAGGAGGAGALGNLDFLRENPQFQQLRQIVQTQPRMLEPILQQVGAGNPQLAQLIGANPDQFLQLLAEDTEGDTPVPPGMQEIQVTEEERAAIERLTNLGFNRDSVIQAYFACDKNEELAANFLFDQPEDDNGPEGGAPGGPP